MVGRILSIDDISLCLGHSSPEKQVTKIYINEDFERADKANRKLIDYLNKDQQVSKIKANSTKKKMVAPEMN